MLPAQVGAISGQFVRGAALHSDSLPDSMRCQAVQARAMSPNTSGGQRTWLWVRCAARVTPSKPCHFCEPECFICQWVIGFERKENVLGSNIKQVQ